MPRYAAWGVIRTGIDQSVVVAGDLVVRAADEADARRRMFAILHDHPAYDPRLDPRASVGFVEAVEAVEADEADEADAPDTFGGEPVGR